MVCVKYCDIPDEFLNYFSDEGEK